LGLADLNKIVILQPYIRAGRSFAAQNPGKSFVHHFSQAIGVQFVNKKSGAGGRVERFISGRVVGMTMSVNDVGYPVLQPLGFGQNTIGFKGRIYQGAGFCIFVTNQVTEYSHPGQSYLLNYHIIHILTDRRSKPKNRLIVRRSQDAYGEAAIICNLPVEQRRSHRL
jgi:hypothetical protein